MKLPLSILPRAEEDVRKIFVRYHVLRPALAIRFKIAFNEAVKFIRETPDACSPIFANSRRRPLTKFPYYIYFAIKPDRVVIWSVFHAHRDLKSLT